MVDVQKILEKANALSHEDRILKATEHVEALKKLLAKEGYSEGEVNETLTSLTRLAVDGDNSATEEDFEIFAKATGIKMDIHEFFKLVKRGNLESFVSAMDEFVDSLKPETKKEALEFVATFLTSDKLVSKEETALLIRLAE